MKHETVEYFDGSQKLIGKLIADEQITGQRPAILVFHAFEGRGSFSLNYAKKLAEKGCIAFAVDMYGDAQVANALDDCFKLIAPFLQDRELVRRRAKLAFDTLIQHPLVDKHHIGAIGFCFGGMCVLELARSGAPLAAGISVHGVIQQSSLPTYPVKSKILVLHGYQDPQVPPENLTAFAQEMDTAGAKDWVFTFFGNAKHSFTDPATGTFDPEREKTMGREYNQAAAELSFQYAVDFLQKHLGSVDN